MQPIRHIFYRRRTRLTIATAFAFTACVIADASFSQSSGSTTETVIGNPVPIEAPTIAAPDAPATEDTTTEDMGSTRRFSIISTESVERESW